METSEERLTRLEGEVRRIVREVVELRAELSAQPVEKRAPAPPPRAPEPQRQPEPRLVPESAPIWPPVVTAPPRSAAARARRREVNLDLDLSALLGAKTLAWVGGAVTLLGVVFF